MSGILFAAGSGGTGSGGGGVIPYTPDATVATTANLAANYLNGSAGVGATLTLTAVGVLIIDDISVSLDETILVKDQTSQFQNGIYTVTTAGAPGINAVLTRATNFNSSTNIKEFTLVSVLSGTDNEGTQWFESAPPPFVVGTTAITWAEYTVGVSSVTTNTPSSLTVSPTTGAVIIGTTQGIGTTDSPTFAGVTTGDLVATGGTMSSVLVKSTQVIANISGTYTINPALGNSFVLTATADTFIEATNISNTLSQSLDVQVINSGHIVQFDDSTIQSYTGNLNIIDNSGQPNLFKLISFQGQWTAVTLSQYTQEFTIASDVSITLDNSGSSFFIITGSATIEGINTFSGIERTLYFQDGGNTLVNSLGLLLPNGGNNIVTEAGDLMKVIANTEDPFSTTFCTEYQRASGDSLTGVSSITGTAHQVIASSPTGNVTLSLPQDIDVVSSPTFAFVAESTAPAVTASGTNIGTAFQLSAATNIVTTATTGQGVILPNVTVGAAVTVLNRSTGDIKLYANGSQTINGVAGATGVNLLALAGEPVVGGQGFVFTYSATNTWEYQRLGTIALQNYINVEIQGGSIATPANNGLSLNFTTGQATLDGVGIFNCTIEDSIIGATDLQTAQFQLIPNNQTGTTYTIAYDGVGGHSGDASGYITFDNAAAVTVTLVPSVNLPPLGFWFIYQNIGTGTVTFAPSTGDTISGDFVADAGTWGLVIINSQTGIGGASNWLCSNSKSIQSVTNAITAAGANRATATALTTDINNVTTVPGATGVELPTGVIGEVITVFNNGANALTVYAPGAATLNGTAGVTGITMQPTLTYAFYYVAANEWIFWNPGALLGTMAYQNANAVDISGGIIANTLITPGQVIANITGTYTINPTLANIFNLTATADCVISIGSAPAMPNGEVIQLQIISSGFNITFDSSVTPYTLDAPIIDQQGTVNTLQLTAIQGNWYIAPISQNHQSVILAVPTSGPNIGNLNLDAYGSTIFEITGTQPITTLTCFSGIERILFFDNITTIVNSVDIACITNANITTRVGDFARFIGYSDNPNGTVIMTDYVRYDGTALIGSGVTSLTGTTNQVITSAATGAVTLSLPQDIATTSSPTFAFVQNSISGTVAAAGTDFSGATQLTAQLNNITSASNNNAGVILPTGVVGRAITIINSSNEIILTYANGSETINGFAGTIGVFLQNGQNATFEFSATNTWVYSANNANIVRSVEVATTANLTATYNNGPHSDGIEATLTNSGTQIALAIDGTTLALNNRVAVQFQSTPAQNGIYYVTNIGSGSTNWVLTRAVDFSLPSQISHNHSIIVINNGTTYAGNIIFCGGGTVTNIGTDAINFVLPPYVLPSNFSTVKAVTANIGSSYTIDPTMGNTFILTLNTTSCALNIGNPPASGALAQDLTVELIPSGGSYTVAYDPKIIFLAGALPIIDQSATTLLYFTGYQGAWYVNSSQTSVIPAAVTAASTIDLDNTASNFLSVFGSASISTITSSSGLPRILTFMNSGTLVNGTNLPLPGGANIAYSAGDILTLVGFPFSPTNIISYTKANGQSVGFAQANWTEATTTAPDYIKNKPTLGTIASQNANAVALTGGAVDGITIGAFTPAAGTFTNAIATTGTFGTIFMSAAAAVTASGTNIGTAFQLTNQVNNVSTVTSGTGVILPTGVVDNQTTIYNNGANALQVYAGGSATINGMAGAVGISMPVGSRYIFDHVTTGTWIYTVYGTGSGGGVTSVSGNYVNNTNPTTPVLIPFDLEPCVLCQFGIPSISYTYNNGTAGVGATLTGTSNGALSVDGFAVSVGDSILWDEIVTLTHNGAYVCTQTGSPSTPYILTRRGDYNTSAQIFFHTNVLITSGNTYKGSTFFMSNPSTITVGTTDIPFTQVTIPFTNVGITGGTIDGTIIGSSNPVAARFTIPVNAQTGTSYTFVVGDIGKTVTFNNASAITVTIPNSTTLSTTVGTQFYYEVLGAGTVTFQTQTGDSLIGFAIARTNASGIIRRDSSSTFFNTGGTALRTGIIPLFISGTVTNIGYYITMNIDKNITITSATQSATSIVTAGNYEITISGSAVGGLNGITNQTSITTTNATSANTATAGNYILVALSGTSAVIGYYIQINYTYYENI